MRRVVILFDQFLDQGMDHPVALSTFYYPYIQYPFALTGCKERDPLRGGKDRAGHT